VKTAQCQRAAALRLAAWPAFALALLALSGCAHHRNVAQLPPPAQLPPQRPIPPETYPPAPTVMPPARIPITPVPPGGVSDEDLDFVNTHMTLPLQNVPLSSLV